MKKIMVDDLSIAERVAEAMSREMDRWPSEMIWSSISRVPMGGMRVTISGGGLMTLARVAITAYRSELVNLAQDRRVESAVWQGRAEVAEAELASAIDDADYACERMQRAEAQLAEMEKENADLHSESEGSDE